MSSLLVFCLAGVVTGICAGSGAWPGVPPLVSFLLFTAVQVTLRPRKAMRRMLQAAFPLGSTAFVLFGLTGFLSVTTSLYEPAGGESLTIIGRIAECREIANGRIRLIINVDKQFSGGTASRGSGRLLLTARRDALLSFQPGDRWRFGGLRINRISDKPLKNGFVPAKYWMSRGIRHEARFDPGDAKKLREGGKWLPVKLFGNWQSYLGRRIDCLPAGPQARGLVKAMVIGDRDDIARETTDHFSRAGIIHVLSVSGLHVGIIYLIIFKIILLTGLAGRRPGTVAALACVWIYTGITGMSPSAVRAAGMISFAGGSTILRRGTPPLTILAGTALIHCLIDPFAVMNAGAQLSYLAVTGIFLWQPLARPWLARLKRPLRDLAGSIIVSLAAQSLIIPVLLCWFGWMPLYFLPGNLILVPVLVICFYLGIGLTVIGLAGIRIEVAGALLDILTGWGIRGAEWLGNLPGNLFRTEHLDGSDLVLYYGMVLLGWHLARHPKVMVVRAMLWSGLILSGAGLIVRLLSG